MPRSLCRPGQFGAHCEHNISFIFHDHQVYEDFTPVADAVYEGFSPDYAFYRPLVEQIAPTLIVEVGVWKGLSALHLARALKATMGGGALIAVDTWLGALEFWTRRSQDRMRDLQLVHGYPSVYYHFLSNVVNQRLADFVIPLPAPSRLASDLLKLRKASIDLLHIDAAHEYESVREDIGLWWGLLSRGGMLLGDECVPRSVSNHRAGAAVVPPPCLPLCFAGLVFVARSPRGRRIASRLARSFVQGWPGVVRAACEFAVEQRVELHTGDELIGEANLSAGRQERFPCSRASPTHCTRRTWQAKWWIIKPKAEEPSSRMWASALFREKYLASCRHSAVHIGFLPPKRISVVDTR